MSEDEERAKKQAFLNEEIIEKNFSPEVFIEFCEKSRGADIDLWTFEELKECVRAFTTQKPPEEYGKTDILECKTIGPTCLTDEVVKVVITKPEKVKGTISKFFFFYVVTYPLGYSVQRKLSDFQWLKESLTHEFPGHFIPHISKTTNKKLEDPLELNTQLKQLSMFMDFLISVDLFKRSQTLLNFLQVENRDNLRKIKKTKIKKPTEARNFATADGKILLDFEDHTDYTKSMEEYFIKQREISKKMLIETRNMKRILLEMSLSMNNYNGLMIEASELSSYMPKFVKPVKEFYAKTAQVFQKINEKIWLSTVNVNDCLYGTVKFLKNQGKPLMDIYKEKDGAIDDVVSIKAKIGKLLKNDKEVDKKLTDKCRACQEKASVLNYLCKSQTEKVIEYSARTLFKDFIEFWVKASSELTGILTAVAMFQDSLEISKGLLEHQF